MIAAAYYRFRVIAPGKIAPWLDSRASDLFDAVVNQVDGNGWLNHVGSICVLRRSLTDVTPGQVVNPEYPWSVYSGQSPEGQSVLGLLWAARSAAGV